MTLTPLGDSAVVLAVGAGLDESVLARVRAIAAAIERDRPAGVVDVVPAFATVTVFYEPAHSADYAALCAALEARAARAEAAVPSGSARLIEIPICYGGEFGPDLGDVALRSGLTAEQVVALHCGANYLVHAIGFTPGFGYLGGLPEKIHTPRRATPRTQVPAGTLGIGGELTGVYPLVTPGGWNLIGRTPLKMFDAFRAESALLQAGDRVRFTPIAPDEFARIHQECHLIGDIPSEGGNEKFHSLRDTSSGVAVNRAGMLTTVQDLGRRGHRAVGVPLSGAMDPFALRVANLLVGNAENTAGLEFTLLGPELIFARDTLVAVGGGDFGALPLWQPVVARAGEPLRFSGARRGCRGYLAVAGGFAIEPVLGSRSTFLRAGFGGWQGRALRDGDVLHAPEFARRIAGHWHLDERILPAYSTAPTVRVVRGAQAGDFHGELFSSEFKVSPQSDRMGVRLTGPAIVRGDNSELVSATVVPGTIQVPPDGQPIVLMADAQTIGGYPQVAHVISVDLPLIAQLRPGDTLRFRKVTLAEAHEAAHLRERVLGMLREGLAQKF